MAHPSSYTLFAEVVLPISLDKAYTYAVPDAMHADIKVGKRVEVQFGKSKRYAAIVTDITREIPSYQTKAILSVIDEEPILNRWQLDFWQWMASYYCCTIGDVMHAALPASMKMSSETQIQLLESADEDMAEELDDDEYLIWEALHHKKELSLDQVRKLLDKQSVLVPIHNLFRKGIISVREELTDPYKPRVEKYLIWGEGFGDEDDQVKMAFDLAERSEKQTRALLAFMQLKKKDKEVRKDTVQHKAEVDIGVLRALEKKGVLEIVEKEVSRIEGKELEDSPVIVLSEMQENCYKEIVTFWKDHDVVLMHGITGSGKTWIYKKFMEEAIEKGEQVLYLLPEIALTVQIIQRLRKIFGDKIVIAHSRLSNNARVDLWKAVRDGVPVILGVRSSVFLPFKNLKTIIVDEEHDASFKQVDPAPRYNARDSAIYLAIRMKAKVLLGTATPSVNSYFNAKLGKYGLVQLTERYSAIRLPDIHFVDLRRDRLGPQSQFSKQLHSSLEATLEEGKQAIIFKNRRGYAPVMRCQRCDWQAMCHQCDVSLTYHKFRDCLQCHYCGSRLPLPTVCPACGTTELQLTGYGTEKLEDELNIMFPDSMVGRMDYDTTKRKDAHLQLINDFEDQKIQILVGTQMVTKGLDFDHVGLVGVINADMQLYFPNFRSEERTYQLLTQVSGRAGRKHSPGKVIVQTYRPDHPVFADLALGDFRSFYNREIKERKAFFYPPFSRLIKITLKHVKKQTVDGASRILANALRKKLDKQVLGPAEPQIGRIRNQYLMDIGIKLPPNINLIRNVKEYLKEQIVELSATKGYTTVRVNVDVDPVE